MTSSQQGFLLISDITGYTLYLTKSELEHAQATLTALLELLVAQTKPPLIIAQLAGDAVMSYALQGNSLQGQTFVEMIETTYIAFRRAIELMVLNNNCQCNACTHIATLDLKFFIHYGAFMIQHVMGRDELVGSDVILIHRLLKNHVTEQTGVRAYTLYTDSAIRQLGLSDFCETWVSHREEYEHIGAVQAWVQDMHPIWEAQRRATHFSIPPERIALQVETEIRMPPYLVWDYLIRPEFRGTLLGADALRIANRKQGRIAPGSALHCYHGEHVLPQTILAWEPFEQMTSEDVVPVPISKAVMLENIRLIPTESGTHLVQTFSKASGPWLGRLLADYMIPRRAKVFQQNSEAFGRQIETDVAARGTRLEAGKVPAETINAAAAVSLTESEAPIHPPP